MARFSRCQTCGGVIGWIECPTGGWWAHEVHLTDDHDAEPVEPPTTEHDDDPTGDTIVAS